MIRAILKFDEAGMSLRFSKINGWYITPNNGITIKPGEKIPVVFSGEIVGSAEAAKSSNKWAVITVGPDVEGLKKAGKIKAASTETLLRDRIVQRYQTVIKPISDVVDMLSPSDVEHLWKLQKYTPTEEDIFHLSKLNEAISLIAGDITLVELKALPIGAGKIHHAGAKDPESAAKADLNQKCSTLAREIFRTV